jgi:hypothetical protein
MMNLAVLCHDENSPFAQPYGCLSVSKFPGAPQMDSPIAEPALKIDALSLGKLAAIPRIGRSFPGFSCSRFLEKRQPAPVQNNTANGSAMAVCIAQLASKELQHHSLAGAFSEIVSP